MSWMARGIESSGKMRPDSRTCGIRVNIASCMACCWFWETVEMSSPRPSVVKTSRMLSRMNTGRLPAKVISKR